MNLQMEDVLSLYAYIQLEWSHCIFLYSRDCPLKSPIWGRNLSIPDNANYSLMALLIITALIVGKSAQGWPGGGDGAPTGGENWVENDVIPKGCYCHNDEQLEQGMYSLKGIPKSYFPETIYNITLTVNDTNVERAEADNGRYGGFLVIVTEGKFVSDENFWIGGDGAYISHSEDNSIDRSWVFQWNSPTEGTGDALFTIYFNVVNGGEASSGDQWSSLTSVSLGTPQEASKEVSIHELGVTLMQYWIGLLGIAVVLLSVLISYIVMRGGSSHYRG